MNISLGKNLEDYIKHQINSGRFKDANEVLRDALGRQMAHQLKLSSSQVFLPYQQPSQATQSNDPGILKSESLMP